MQFDWQNVAVVALVVAAGAYLARAAWRSFARRRAGNCGGCGTCASNAGQPEVVELGRTAEPTAHHGRHSGGPRGS